jgi:hypothetical protein
MSTTVSINYSAVKKSVEKLVLDVKSKVIAEFDTYVKVHVDEESYESLKELFEGFQTQLSSMNLKLEEEMGASKTATGKKGSKKSPTEPKPKKALSAYNIFIKETIEGLKKSNPEMKGQELMKAATEAWKKQKPTTTTA